MSLFTLFVSIQYSLCSVLESQHYPYLQLDPLCSFETDTPTAHAESIPQAFTLHIDTTFQLDGEAIVTFAY